LNRTVAYVIAALAALFAGCATLPPPEGRTATTAFTDTAQTRLGRGVAAEVAAHPGKTGIHAMPAPRDAFAARVLLAAAAERSIDAQYFVWHGDQVGTLLFEALWRAAERGVRVRLLLDDLGTEGLDSTIGALDAHANVEVRLYNPFLQRDARLLGFMMDFSRLNRRMHNKSFTVDNQASVVGGRNIGNEYFGAGTGLAFADLDVIAVGAAVPEVSKEFDLYWNGASAYPAAAFVGTGRPEGAAALQARFASARADPEGTAYIEAVRTTPLVRDLLNGSLEKEWTDARLVYDDPAKTLDRGDRTDVLLFPQLVGTMGRPERTLDLVTPYFVPGEDGTAALGALAARGVKVRILTNSLASSDVTAVHSGYAKRRADLLRAGVRLYELKPTAARESREVAVAFGSGSSSALHAKTFAVDGARIFVGSFNFDQRSARLNTEMGLVIGSLALAQRLGRTFDDEVPRIAYEVRLAPEGGGLQWIERTAGGEIRHDTEPGTSWWLRTKVEFLSILPIEWML
jgi:putative cardiolipin synthase